MKTKKIEELDRILTYWHGDTSQLGKYREAILKWHDKHTKKAINKMELEIVMFIDDYVGKLKEKK